MDLNKINELTKQAYDKTAEKYHENFKCEVEQKEYDRLILDRFSGLLKKNSSICDAGCGPSCQIGRYLAAKGHRITGIDISEKCIGIASSYNPNVVCKTMDIMKTVFENDYFDGIVSFYSIIYTPKKYIIQIFNEFNRILKKNGKLLIVVKKGTNEGIIEDDWYEGNKVYFSHFLEEEIKNYFERSNFNVDFMDTRQPYDFELKVDRIYAIGTKNN